MAEFLASCVFGAHCKVQLELGILESQAVALLRPFFARSSIRMLTIDVSPEAMNKIGTQIMSIDKLEFHMRAPPTSLFDRRTLPKSLWFHSHAGEDKDFWAILDHFATGEQPPQVEGTTTLLITWEDNLDFDWLANEDTDHDIFVGRLTKLAAPLYKRGIVVTDMHGRNVTTLV
jgi:hypothetical protein